MAALGNQNRQSWKHSSLSVLLPSFMMVPLTGQSWKQESKGVAVWSLEFNPQHRTGQSVGGGWF